MPAENGLVFVGTWNIRLNFMASEFFGKQRDCRFYTVGCGNKIAGSVTGSRAVNELGCPVIPGTVTRLIFLNNSFFSNSLVNTFV